MDMTTFLSEMYRNLEEQTKGFLMNNTLLDKWKLLSTAVQERKWDDVEKNINAFENAYRQIRGVNLNQQGIGYRKYQSAKQDMLLIKEIQRPSVHNLLQVAVRSSYDNNMKNIKQFPRYTTTIAVGKQDVTPPTDNTQENVSRQEKFEAEAKFMNHWINWLDKEVLTKNITILPEDPQQIKRENVSKDILRLEEVFRRASKRIIDTQEKIRRQEKFEAEAKFMYHWINWLDKDVLTKNITILPEDPQHMKKENISKDILRFEEVFRRASKTIIDCRQEKVDLLEMNKALTVSRNKGTSSVQELKKYITKLKYDNEDLSSKLEKSEEEKDYWMNRMSKVAGNKLTDNNPAIADLSDTNRPQKTAERYAELYDNEWTDALNKLKKEKDHETSNISKMTDILRICHESCRMIASTQMKQLYHAITNITLEPVEGKSTRSQTDLSGHASGEEAIQKILSDTRKETANLVFDSVKQVVMEELKKKHSKEITLIPAFVDSCLQITWKMVIQRPELCFLWPKTGKDEKVNKDQFSQYTRSGCGVEFVVWPAMLLHENGPLLRKGTFQPYLVQS